uniref:Uncharacterized protein n=1 Tax=Rhizophora mucronata TaxID=61149 RepID=A0A2P2J9J8_RHIMU
MVPKRLYSGRVSYKETINIDKVYRIKHMDMQLNQIPNQAIESLSHIDMPDYLFFMINDEYANFPCKMSVSYKM